MDTLILTIGIFSIVLIITIVVVLIFINNKRSKKYKDHLDNLAILKNKIIDIPVLSELNKVEGLIKNKKLELKYKNWHDNFKTIKEKQIPKITDIILETEFLIEKRDYKQAISKIAKIELDIHQLKTRTNNILKDIKAVTTSEERNRNAITKLKTKYRELYEIFSNSNNSYITIKNPIEDQFQIIDKDFDKFESLMEINDYDEVIILIKSINKKLMNLDIVMKELDDIILLGKTYIPKKIEDISGIYSKMMKEGFVLEHLNIEYNVEEIATKINYIFDRLNKLDTKDSLFELKVFIEYFDNLYRSFEKERKSKKELSELLSYSKSKITRINKIVEHIYSNIDNITTRYTIDKKTLSKLDKNKTELSSINYEFKSLMDQNNSKSFAFSIILKEVNSLKSKIIAIEDNLDITINSIGNMREDEKRAKQQLEEIKILLKKAKFKMRSYKLPILNDNYFVQLTEASEAIRNIVKEINKKPIDINTLNIRVDTGRDLVFKFFKTSNDLIQNAALAENTIILAHKYLPQYPSLENKLDYSNKLFFDGNYKYSLDNTLDALDEIDPGIKDKLISQFSK